MNEYQNLIIELHHAKKQRYLEGVKYKDTIEYQFLDSQVKCLEREIELMESEM